MPKGPPLPDEIFDNLMRIIRPPVPPWIWMKQQREVDEFTRRRKPKEVFGSRMIWPFRIAWSESSSGRGVIKVLRNEKVIGTVSYMDRDTRISLVNTLEGIVKGVK